MAQTDLTNRKGLMLTSNADHKITVDEVKSKHKPVRTGYKSLLHMFTQYIKHFYFIFSVFT